MKEREKVMPQETRETIPQKILRVVLELTLFLEAHEVSETPIANCTLTSNSSDSIAIGAFVVWDTENNTYAELSRDFCLYQYMVWLKEQLGIFEGVEIPEPPKDPDDDPPAYPPPEPTAIEDDASKA